MKSLASLGILFAWIFFVLLAWKINQPIAGDMTCWFFCKRGEPNTIQRIVFSPDFALKGNLDVYWILDSELWFEQSYSLK